MIYPSSNLQIDDEKDFILQPMRRVKGEPPKDNCRNVDVKLPTAVNFIRLIVINLVKEPVTLIWNLSDPTGNKTISSSLNNA